MPGKFSTTKIQFQPVLCQSLKDKFLTQGHDLSPEKLGSHLVFLPIWIDLADPFRHGDTTLSLNHVAPSCTLNFLCVCVSSENMFSFIPGEWPPMGKNMAISSPFLTVCCSSSASGSLQVVCPKLALPLGSWEPSVLSTSHPTFHRHRASSN